LSPHPTTSDSKGSDIILSSSERAVIGFFVQLALSLGLPRSLGELYGLLYCAETPLPFDDVVEILGISKGSASQGLHTLQSLNAVHIVYHPRDRRTFYRAELSLRQILTGFLETKLQPFLHGTGEGVERLADAISAPSVAPALSTRKVLRKRVQGLQTWHSRLTHFLPLLARLAGQKDRLKIGPGTP